MYEGAEGAGSAVPFSEGTPGSIPGAFVFVAVASGIAVA